MSYAGTLAMPSNYVVMDEDEMMYLEGGALGTYSGAKGWALAGALATAGGMLAGVSGAGLKALVASAATIFAGGAFAWIGAALVGASLGAIGVIGKCFLGASKDAAWLMARQGHYHLSIGSTPWQFVTVSK